MAFVSAIPLGAARPTADLSSRTPLPHLSAPSAVSPATPRMGYGAYSYSTDKTKGHTRQYYVDKFRVTTDFTRGAPATQADAFLGCDVKHSPLVPKQGIPQPLDDALPPRDESVTPDPRIAESEGAVYPWDVNYVDPKFLPSTYADISNDTVAENAFQNFRESMWQDRCASLSAMDFGAVYRVNRIKEGLDESTLLTLRGALDVVYARLQHVDEPATLSPTGRPQTEIPGTPYLSSVGAIDFLPKPGDSIAFWNDAPGTDVQPELHYKRPSGNATPDLPYNTNPTVDAIKEAQEARNLLPPLSD